MPQQIPLGSEARAEETDPRDGTHQIRPDLAYSRLVMVNVVFFGAPGAGDRNWVLVDAGLVGTRSLIESAAAARFGEGARPSAVVLTHGHFDHVGALKELAAAWDVPVYAHPLEHPYLDGSTAYLPGDPSVGGGLMASLAGLYPTRPVDVSGHLRTLPEDGSVPGMEGWRWIHTPGHSPGHVSLWPKEDRTLIAGDAFATTAPESAYATAAQAPEMHGPPSYFTSDWIAARASIERLAALDPALAVTGHGRPMAGAAMAGALDKLAQDFDTVAVPRTGRHVEHLARERPTPSRIGAWLGEPVAAHAVNLAVAAFTGYALATLIHSRRPHPALVAPARPRHAPEARPETVYRGPSPDREDRSSIRYR